MFLDYEPATHYFRAGAILPALSVLLALLSALSASLAILLRKEPFAESPFFSHKNFSSSSLGFLLSGTVLLIDGGSDTLRVAAGVLLLDEECVDVAADFFYSVECLVNFSVSLPAERYCDDSDS
ncbi:MAG: hypothetical protein IIX05_03135, partial [Selenomonadaceae bacterium]|nr:hypothetical protein [Selenomonadaceae bacterium]